MKGKQRSTLTQSYRTRLRVGTDITVDKYVRDLYMTYMYYVVRIFVH